MKSQQLKIFFTVVIIIIAGSIQGQKQHTQIATRTNSWCNATCTLLNIPELDNNPSAIIMATPLLENNINLNPHPIAAYYTGKQWSIINVDQVKMPEGSKFTVEYYPSADQNHFQYIIKKEDLLKDGSALIDHRALNDNPNARLRFFQNWSPQIRGGIANRDDINMQYNNEFGKWQISNISKKPLVEKMTYNIIISDGSNANTNPVKIDPVNNSKVITNANNATQKSNSNSGPVTQMYMTVWANGIKLPGDNLRKGYPDKMEILGFDMGASNPVSSGMVAGKRVYEPVTIKTTTGLPPTIPLFNAFAKSQTITVTIETYSTSMNRAEELIYTIKLSSARIVSFKQTFEESTGGSTKKYFDEIKIIFSKIEYIKDGVTVEDNL